MSHPFLLKPKALLNPVFLFNPFAILHCSFEKFPSGSVRWAPTLCYFKGHSSPSSLSPLSDLTWKYPKVHAFCPLLCYVWTCSPKNLLGELSSLLNPQSEDLQIYIKSLALISSPNCISTFPYLLGMFKETFCYHLKLSRTQTKFTIIPPSCASSLLFSLAFNGGSTPQSTRF